MYTLSNDHVIDFCAAAGALNFTGRGYWWEQPLRLFGLLRPREFTIITPTLTMPPRVGNLKWWCPWRCVRLIPGGAVNSKGLTNPGLLAWVWKCYPVILKLGYSVIVSIQPTTVLEARTMASILNRLDGIKGIQVNVSCPNTQDEYDPVEVVRTVQQYTFHPILVKLGANQLDLITKLEPFVESFELINTVRWGEVFPDRPSPLASYGLEGGVSGEDIRIISRQALVVGRTMTNKPIQSGGGINSLKEVLWRKSHGANGYVMGTSFLRRPWLPNQIARLYRIDNPPGNFHAKNYHA